MIAIYRPIACLQPVVEGYEDNLRIFVGVDEVKLMLISLHLSVDKQTNIKMKFTIYRGRSKNKKHSWNCFYSALLFLDLSSDWEFKLIV